MQIQQPSVGHVAVVHHMAPCMGLACKPCMCVLDLLGISIQVVASYSACLSCHGPSNQVSCALVCVSYQLKYDVYQRRF